MLEVTVGGLIQTASLPCASALHQECIRLTLTAQKEQAEEQLRAEYEELRLRSRRELQQLQEQLAKLQQHCTDSLLQAECHKQQVCVYISADTTDLFTFNQDIFGLLFKFKTIVLLLSFYSGAV